MADDDLRALEKRFAGGDTEAGALFLSTRERLGLCVFHGGPVESCNDCAEIAAIDWASVFAEGWSEKADGASAAELEQLKRGLGLPLNEDELADLREDERKLERITGSSAPSRIDPLGWPLPELPLPPSYLSFLAWSNGGNFSQGERELGFFPASKVREYLLAYQVPEYMPGAVPIAFDGGGTFYLLDLRSPPVAGDYPILFAHAGSLGFDSEDCYVVARTFLEACQGTTDPHADRDPRPQVSYPELVDVWLVKRPEAGLKGILTLKKALKLQTSVRELKGVFDSVPAPLLRSVPFFPNGVLSARFNNEGDACLEVREPGETGQVDLSGL